MAATFEFQESNGAGQTITSARTEVNWKNIDDSTTAYTAAPITASNNSFEKWQAGHFSGTFNQILAGLFSHTAGTTSANITIKGQKAMTADGDRLTYTTPSTTANALLTNDLTAITAIASGVAVWFGATSANAAGKAASMTTNPCWSNYLTTQNQVGAAASPGDMTQITLTLEYQEN